MEHSTYEEYVEATRYDYPHTGRGECSSDCGNTVDCPVMSKEEWEELKALDERKVGCGCYPGTEIVCSKHSKEASENNLNRYYCFSCKKESVCTKPTTYKNCSCGSQLTPQTLNYI